MHTGSLWWNLLCLQRSSALSGAEDVKDKALRWMRLRPVNVAGELSPPHPVSPPSSTSFLSIWGAPHRPACYQGRARCSLQLSLCKGTLNCNPLFSWNGGVQDTHPLQQNLLLPVSHWLARWQPLTPLQIALLFYSCSGAAVKQLMYFVLEELVFQWCTACKNCFVKRCVFLLGEKCCTNKDHCHLMKFSVWQMFCHGLSFRNGLGSQHRA